MIDRNSWSHPPELVLLADPVVARWVETCLSRDFGTVGSLIPSGFQKYLRLFHPARAHDGARVRWETVARWSNRVVHPLMAFERISVFPEGQDGMAKPWEHDPNHGTLDQDDLLALSSLLATFRGSAERCFFAMWEGYGQFGIGSMKTVSGSGSKSVYPPRDVQTAQRLHGVERDYLVYSGPLARIEAFMVRPFRNSPNFWWPEDRAWFVSTDIDLDSTYIGCTEELASVLARDAQFEVLETRLDVATYFTADTINAA